MPFKLHTVSVDIWQKRPELAVWFATISQIWSIIEFRVSLVFMSLAGSNRLVVGDIFLDVFSIATRIKMLKKLAALGSLEPQDHKYFMEICKQLEKCAKIRAKLVHGTWALEDAEVDGIFLVRHYPSSVRRITELDRSERWNQENFSEVTVQMNELNVKLQYFHDKLIGIQANGLARQQRKAAAPD